MKKTVATETVCSSKVQFWYQKGLHLKGKRMYFQRFIWRQWTFSFVPSLWWVFSILFLHLLLGFKTFCLPLLCSHCLNANKALGSYKQWKLFLKEQNTFAKYNTDPKESSAVKLKNFFKDERYFHFGSLSG